MESNLLSLKNNPIFQLSLASKELFHTNFLYWLAISDNLRPVFCNIINEMLGSDCFLFKNDNDTWKIGNDSFDDSNFVVLREYNNFDLCICKVKETNESSAEEDKSTQVNVQDSNDVKEVDKNRAGEIIFVLENKFKSICSKEQLDRYNERILEYNQKYYKLRSKKGKGQIIKDEIPKLILLSLTKEFVEKSAIEELGAKTYTKQISKEIKCEFSGLNWHLADYKFLATLLKNHTSTNQNDFNYQLINQYANFIECFSEELNKKIKNLTIDSKWADIYNPCEFDEIRCRDIWQKNIMHKYAQDLAKIIRDKNPNYEIDFDSSDSHTFDKYEREKNKKIYIGVYFSHGNAALEIKCRISQNMMYCIVQQGEMGEGIVVYQDEKNSPSNIKKSKKKEDKGSMGN